MWGYILLWLRLILSGDGRMHKDSLECFSQAAVTRIPSFKASAVWSRPACLLRDSCQENWEENCSNSEFCWNTVLPLMMASWPSQGNLQWAGWAPSVWDLEISKEGIAPQPSVKHKQSGEEQKKAVTVPVWSLSWILYMASFPTGPLRYWP